MAAARQSRRIAAKANQDTKVLSEETPSLLNPKHSKNPHTSPHGVKRRKLNNPSRSKVVKSEVDDLPAKEECIELPHGLGRQPIERQSPDDGESKRTTKVELPTPIKSADSKPASKRTTVDARKKIKGPYGLKPGTSPFPEYPSPTAEDCEVVHRLLTSVHGARKRPKTVPRASATVTGCGEVPFVLDAVLRTLLSANTSGRNSATALKGLITAFGSVDDSPDWDAVRRATLPAVVESIKRGGLANVKAANIKAILDAVYDRNMKEASGVKDTQDMSTTTTPNPKKGVIGQNPALRIDYISKMNDEDAMNELVTLPGIGVKTAACVLMFNMGRDVFAVDTHIYRLCQWLGWLPDTKGMTRDKAFSHLEVRIPNHLKYPLHKQLIIHGRECVRCRANTSPNSQGWEDANCPIEHLVKRAGPMKTGKRGSKSQSSPRKAGNRKKGRRKNESSEEVSDSEIEDALVEDDDL